ncbi:type VI secretion system tube protein TssD [Tenacibaculum sp. SDUM215027]|uniref:type VI secretion system tube protein TssD n=1 Tax=Tenacibaculum sp. SDUM215027 TaxID=3422596 RepID=UPI003D31292D
MNVKAKLFVCGEERELFNTNLNYDRFIDWNGKPTSALMGGTISVTFESQMYDDSFLEWIIADRTENKKIPYPFDLYQLREGKVVFYQDDFDGLEIFEYSFKDATLINYHEKFCNQAGMQVTLTISPAMQDYRFFNNSSWSKKSTTRYIKHWQESFIPIKEVAPYKAKEDKEPKREKYFVEKIEIENLDEGSDNGGSNKKEGLIHGKEYTLKVTKYKNDKTPKNSNSIKWSYGYTNVNGEIVIGSIKQKGDKITFKTNNLDYCGYKITFYAYIENKENEAELEVFHHYRFRWFDRKTVEKQISQRKHSPWRIDQGASSLCGIALAGFYLARDNFDLYESYIKEIHQKGSYLFKDTNYQIEIDSDKHLIKYKTTDAKYPEQSYSTAPMEEIDYIFLLTIKDNLNLVWDYDPDNKNVGGFAEGGTGLTLPNEIETIFKKINNFSDVIDETNLITSKWSNSTDSVSQLKKLIQDNYKVAILIEGSAFQNNKKASFSVPTHWVGVLDVIDNSKNEEIEILVYTWGKKNKKWKLSYDVFEDSYYGYVAGK